MWCKAAPPQLCGRCTLDGISGYIDTPEHRYYTCTANKKIQDDMGYLRRSAKANTWDVAKAYPCLWARGLVPRQSWRLQEPHVNPAAMTAVSFGFKEAAAKGWQLYIDGSGQPAWSTPHGAKGGSRGSDP